ncbi:hypothetical protein [Corynebacterium epidermidicanis]|uniref:Uncharacterized protein n=1 Tax=Corynebacterium epidermidicanis TaxID=1050174 RepID=A0A0G3GT21_9CORY|nr:hypothetical protein [Corynebacterium epidermidicanis]AKK03685.1 hypothetical protein CEPID_09195 [Corynebacterium epidermidicanis]
MVHIRGLALVGSASAFLFLWRFTPFSHFDVARSMLWGLSLGMLSCGAGFLASEFIGADHRTDPIAATPPKEISKLRRATFFLGASFLIVIAAIELLGVPLEETLKAIGAGLILAAFLARRSWFIQVPAVMLLAMQAYAAVASSFHTEHYFFLGVFCTVLGVSLEPLSCNRTTRLCALLVCAVLAYLGFRLRYKSELGYRSFRFRS